MTRWHILHHRGRIYRKLGESPFDRRIRSITEAAIAASLKEIEAELRRRFA